MAARAAGARTRSARSDGTTTDALTPYTVSSLSTITAIAPGTDFTCALHADGTGECWGRGFAGALGNDSTTDVTQPAPAPIKFFP